MKLNFDSSMINWWLQGLVLLVPTGLKNLFNPEKKRILIQLQNHHVEVIWPTLRKGHAGPELYDLDQSNHLKKFIRQLTKFSKDHYNLVLCIPANKGLRKFIKLPVNAEADLSRILDYEIDRQTPFTRDQVYSGFRVIEKNISTNTLNVELNVIPKKLVDPQLDELHKVEITPQVVELLNDQTDPGINVLQGSIVHGNHSSSRHLNSFLLLLALILTGIVIFLPFWNLESSLKQTEIATQKARSGAMEVNELRSSWEKEQQKQNLLNKTIDNHRSVTTIISELTHLIPDNTWLTRLHIKGETIRLQGESSAATSLISTIEESGHFSGTRFQSPVTSNISTGKDRFQILTQASHEETSE